MKKVIFGFLMIVGLGCVLNGADIKKVVAVSEEWEDGTNADGSGFYWELIDLVYQKDGISVEKSVMPYERAVNMVKNGKADLWVGSYMDEEEFALYPKHAMDSDIVVAVFKKGAFDISKGQSEIEGKRVGWIRGYDYDSYLEVPVEVSELRNRASGIKMVQGGRLDAFLDAKIELDSEIENSKIDSSDIDIGEILQLKLYIGFNKDDRGKKLSKIWDERMIELHNSGELKTFYNKHGYTSYYPF